MKKVIKIFMWLISSLLGFILFLPLINLLMLGIRALQSLDPTETKLGFFELALGFPSFALLALSWPMFLIYCYHYYRDSKTIWANFLQMITVEFYLFPLLAVIYQITFPAQLNSSAWTIAAGSLIVGTTTGIIKKYVISPAQN